jgi:hypothetical protein
MAARKIRSDSTVKSAENRLGIKNAIRNADGTNARGDKKIETLRKEEAQKKRTSGAKGAKKATRQGAQVKENQGRRNK